MLASRFASWEHLLTDVYLLSTVLLLAGMTVMYRLKQPARRIAVARSIAVGLFSLAIIAFVPGWPRIATFRWPASASIFEPQVESPRARFETARGKSAEQVDMNVAIGPPREPEIAPPPAYADALVSQRPLSLAGLPSWRIDVDCRFHNWRRDKPGMARTRSDSSGAFTKLVTIRNSPDSAACSTNIAGVSHFTARRPKQSHLRSGCDGDGPANDHLA